MRCQDRFFVRPDGSFACRKNNCDYQDILKSVGFWQEPKKEGWKPPQLKTYK